MVTMKKIAELCNVSRGTVDRVLHGRGRVSEETAANIRRVAKELGYEPNPAAKALSARKTQPKVSVILPISKPALATLFITDFLATWNEYLLASVIINDNDLKTVPVGLMTFVGEHGTDYGYLCAGVLVAVIPVMVVYLIFQNYFVEGMAGAVK